MHGLLDGHRRLAFVDAFLHQLEHAQWQVVEGHIADMGAGVGEGDQGVGVVDHLAQAVFAVVADHGEPAQRATILDHHVEEQIDHVHAALIGHLGKVTADDAAVRAIENHRIAEVALPDPW